MTKIVGYARVSTADQHLDLQRTALLDAGAIRVFEDQGVSGTRTSRPGLEAALDYLRSGDILAVWRLDRLGRGTVHTLTLINDLANRGVGFKSITEGLDTTTATGKAMLGIVAIFAELERDVMIERTKAGLSVARALGRTGGRPPALDARKTKLAQQMYDSGDHTVAEIADTLKVGRATVYRNLHRN
ncbi:recombinase family protein [Cryobacterium zhongshanensis]|uniref:Recombinase family protein n=1 Tax=Cryobacterium zhongshanensis TaxID=2928153 RepID=A0AA41QT05_9MICO|nr:recombinase family protein [Cryobacterium zhongshanensis]MCI4657137.1 recombinase family protein [Cryobacterium zhongshanensis]